MEVIPAIVLDASEPVSKAASELTRNGNLVIITKGKQYHGIIDDRSLRNSRNDPSKTKCEALCERAPLVKINDTLVDVCKAFFAGRFSALPVVSGNKIEGVITRADVIRLLLAEKMLDGKKVSEAMSAPVLTIAHDAGMGAARKLMREKNVRRLVVTKNEKLAGIISTFDLATIAAHERDVRPSGMSEKYSAEKEWVERFMRESIETIGPDAPLGDAARKMLDAKVASVVVVGAGKAIGIVTAKDLFETAMVTKESERIFISGLHDHDKELYGSVHAECEKLLEKLDRETGVEYLALHIKKHGSESGNSYAVRARLVGKGMITASAAGFDLHGCVAQVASELKTQVEKRKPNRMHIKSRE